MNVFSDFVIIVLIYCIDFKWEDDYFLDFHKNDKPWPFYSIIIILFMATSLQRKYKVMKPYLLDWSPY